MAQPSSLPRWSDVVSGDPTRVLQPTSLQADVGWDEGQRPAAEHINWLLWTIYLWCNYLKNLNTEALSWTVGQTFGAGITVTGAASVSTNLTVGGTLGVTGVTTVGVLHATSNADIDGTFNADGAASFGAGITAVANIQAGAKLTAGTNCEIAGNFAGATATLSGTASATDFRFSSSRTRWVYIAASQVNDGNWDRFGGAGGGMKYDGTAQDSLSVALPLETGEHIVSVTVRWKNTDGAVDFVAQVVTDVDNSVIAPSGGTTLAHSNSSPQTTTITVNASVSASNAQSLYLVAAAGGITSGAFSVFAVGVTVTRP